MVRTADGHPCRFRDFRRVHPDQVGVLRPVAMRAGRNAAARLITLTTCDQPHDAQERLIAYGVLDSFRPAA